MTRVAPRNGMIIIDPITRQPLREVGLDGMRGEDRDLSEAYWYRRQQDGDIEIVEAEPQPTVAPEETKRTPKARKGSDEGK